MQLLAAIRDPGWWGMGAAYALLSIPLAVILWRGVPIVGQFGVSVFRMTVQLLLVGAYLRLIFDLNNPWLNAGWVLVMIGVADATVLRTLKLRLVRFALPLLAALLVGTAIPLTVFLVGILHLPDPTEAQYVIPVGGMILGNCLRADIVGLRTFYQSVRSNERVYLHALAQGATRGEALDGYVRGAIEAALSPTLATMATIGLVALPGMMTGVILGGGDPFAAILYQIAIMIAIFTGTALTVLLAIRLTVPAAFDEFGLLDETIWTRGT
jgi:putative ABC transport system permease protein